MKNNLFDWTKNKSKLYQPINLSIYISIYLSTHHKLCQVGRVMIDKNNFVWMYNKKNEGVNFLLNSQPADTVSNILKKNTS